MKKRIVFFIALFAMSAFINAASVNERYLRFVGHEMISSKASATKVQDNQQCRGNCYALYFYCQSSCPYYYPNSCLQQCQNQFAVCMQACQ